MPHNDAAWSMNFHAHSFCSSALRVLLARVLRPGPQHAVSLAGSEIGNMVFFVPPQGTIASFLTILSYNGGVQMGCLSDVRVIDRPQEVLALFESEFASLKKQVAKLQAEGKLQQTLGLQDKDRG